MKRRKQTRDLVTCNDRMLAQRTRKFLSLSPEFHTQRAPQWWNSTNSAPEFPAWTGKAAQLRQLPCLPFESGSNTLPGMEHFLKLL